MLAGLNKIPSVKIQKDKSEALLFRMLPYSVVRELRKCRESSDLYVGSYQSATVLFADLADFQVFILYIVKHAAESKFTFT